MSRLPLPVLEQVVTPTLPEDYEPPPHPSAVEGGPVMVLTTFVIADESLQEFLDVMEELRRVRLCTGAYGWRLYRNVGDPPHDRGVSAALLGAAPAPARSARRQRRAGHASRAGL